MGAEASALIVGEDPAAASGEGAAAGSGPGEKKAHGEGHNAEGDSSGVAGMDPLSPGMAPMSPSGGAGTGLSPDAMLMHQLMQQKKQSSGSGWDAMEERMMQLQSALILEEEVKGEILPENLSTTGSRLQYLAASELKVGVPEDSLEARLAALSSAMEGSDVSVAALAAAEEAAKLEARAARMREREAKRAAKRAADQAVATAAAAASEPPAVKAMVSQPGSSTSVVVQLTQAQAEAAVKRQQEDEKRKAEAAERERLRKEWEEREDARRQLEAKMLEEREDVERKKLEHEKKKVDSAAAEVAQTIEREKLETGSAYNVQNAVGRDNVLRQILAIPPRASDVTRLTVMLNDGLPEIVCNIMSQHVDDLEMQDAGCHAIRALAVGEDRAKMRSACEKAMDVVCAALEVHGADTHFQLAAFAALGAIAVHISNKVAVVNIVLAGLNADPENAQLAEVVCSALKNSALGDDVHRTNAARAGAVEAILGAIRAHPTAPGVQEQAWAAVKNLSVNAENQVLFAQTGAIEDVLGTLRGLPRVAGVQEQAVWAIRILSFRPENNKAVADAGGVQAVIDAMKMHVNHAGVQETCCGCLRTLAVLPESKIEMVEKGVFVRIVAASRAHLKKPLVQIAAAGLLSALVTNPDAQNRAASAGVIDVLIEVLQVHLRNAKVQQACFTILSSLTAANPENKVRAANSGAVEAAVQALHVHANLTPLAEACCDTLASIVNNESSQFKTLEARGIEAILVACRAHPHRPNLQEKGCKAMTSITWCQPPAQRRAREAGVLKDIMTAMNMYPDHKGVQKQARALMQTIQVEEDDEGLEQPASASDNTLFGLNIRQPNYRYHTL